MVEAASTSKEHHTLCRQRAEDVLRKGDSRAYLLADILDHFPQPFGIGYLDGRVGMVNAAYCDLLGYSEEELQALTWSTDLTPPEWRDDEVQRMRELCRTGQAARFEKEYVRKDGSRVPVEMLVHLVRDDAGQPLYYCAFVTDLSERKRAEEELALERHLIGALMDHVPDRIYFKDRQSRFIRINRATALAAGVRDPASAVGKTDADYLDVTHAREAYTDEQEVMRSGEPIVGKEEKEVWPDGRVTYSSTTKVPLRDDQGQVIGTLGISRDITEKVRLQEQLRQAQKMEAMGRLAAGVAHDFNNLLTVIEGYGEVAMNTLSPGTGECEAVTEILKAVERAAGLTRRLLAFSRRQTLELRVLDLNAVLEGMGKMLERVIGEQIMLQMSLAGDLHRVKANAGQIEQVILNLAVNARDAMPDGGTLTLSTSNVLLDKAHAQAGMLAGPCALLVVRDSGCGMTPEVQARLFEPFYTTKGPGKGTGLGLATVYGIVAQCGGSLAVESEPGRGTTFRIYLPRAEEPAYPSRPEEQSLALHRGQETILVVEDDPAVCRVTVRMARSLGYRVLQAPCAADALRLCENSTEPIHLLLTDVVMPGMNGRELAEVLQRARRGLKVLYVSGYNDDGILRLGVLDGQVPFLQKPFTQGDLAAKLREALQKD